jgi:ribose transport system substrate-binding protein
MKKFVTVALILLVILSSVAFAGGKDQGGGPGGKKDGKIVIALSNSFYGNSWRKQMVESFVEAAEKAKAEGKIDDYIVSNADNTANTQIAQMNSLILDGVSAICVNAFSTTALNSVIEQAIKQGILIYTFDSIVTEPNAYKLDYDFASWGRISVEYFAKRFNGNANILVVRGIMGSSPEDAYYKGLSETIAKYPGLKIVAEVDGEADTATSQSAVANVLPSLGKIDAVITHGGAYGVVQAFEAAGRPVPPIIGGNRAEFVKWWIEENERGGYETISLGSEPSIGAIAFWTTYHILKGEKAPNYLALPLVPLTTENLHLYKDIQPGTVIAQRYDEQWVLKNIFNK